MHTCAYVYIAMIVTGCAEILCGASTVPEFGHKRVIKSVSEFLLKSMAPRSCLLGCSRGEARLLPA